MPGVDYKKNNLHFYSNAWEGRSPRTGLWQFLESTVQSHSPGHLPGYLLEFKVNVGFTPAALCSVLTPESKHSPYSPGS